MKILLLEDEEPAALRLMQLIRDAEPGAELHGPLDTVEAAVEHLKSVTDYDLLFVDIQLADGKSFSIFEKVQVSSPVIFTTAYDEFALKAFELNSIDYLLKPVKKELLQNAFRKYHKMKEHFGSAESGLKLKEVLNYLKSGAAATYRDRFLISKGDALIPVKASEIACFFAGEREVMLMTHDGNKYFISHSIEELSNMLNPAAFFRVNRQFIISSDAIRRVHNYFNFKLKVQLTTDPGQEIIVSKARTAAFKAWMNDERL